MWRTKRCLSASYPNCAETGVDTHFTGVSYIMGKDILHVGGFTIVRRIGIGARSTIYLATDEEDKTEVALKRVIYQRPEDLRIFEQVEPEYKAARRINPPSTQK